jgi:FAD/FMN-containing dehydrogenase
VLVGDLSVGFQMLDDPSLLAQDFERARLSVIDHNHGDYDKLRRVWNSMVDRHPAVIVRATNAQDVAKIVKIAAERQAVLAVRGGGHSLPGLSTCNQGIVLDLSLMKEIVVDPVSCTAKVSGGALLGDLDAAGAAYGLVTPAGVVSHTGVGGLTLGGGMGWLSRRYGLTIDNLLSVHIVTADGRLQQASADQEPDLFWAVRGGGGNFGVVTQFNFRMHPLGPAIVGQWTYPVSAAKEVLQRYREYLIAAPRELTTSFVLTSSVLRINGLWSGSAADKGKSLLMQFGSLGPVTTASVGELSFLELQKAGDERVRWGRRYYAKGGFLREVDERVVEVLVGATALAPTEEAEVYVLQLGGAVCDTDEAATPYSGREAAHYWIAQPIWDDPADDEECLAWGRRTAKQLETHSLRGNYVNEQSDTGVALTAYGKEKYTRLATLKGRYDPTNLFRLNQNIEPKL